jgi:hypothetical protein
MFLPCSIQIEPEDTADLLTTQVLTSTTSILPIQQDALNLRQSELQKLETQLAVSARRLADCEALVFQQRIEFEEENSSKRAKIEELQGRLSIMTGKCLNAAGEAESARMNALEVDNVKSKAELLECRSRISELEAQLALQQSEHVNVQDRLRICQQENNTLLTQIDNSDVLGENYGNADLGAPSEDFQMAIDQQRTLLKSLQDTLEHKEVNLAVAKAGLEAKDVALAALEARLVDRDASLQAKDKGYNTLKSRADLYGELRHKVHHFRPDLDVREFRELDLEAIFARDEELAADVTWDLDNCFIYQGIIEANAVNITVLSFDTEAGVRSVLVKVPVHEKHNITELLACLRSKGAEYAAFLAVPSESSGAITSRRIMCLNDVESFVQTCQTPNSRAFFSPYEHWEDFFTRYARFFQSQGETHRKRARGEMRAFGKRRQTHIDPEDNSMMDTPEEPRQASSIDAQEGSAVSRVPPMNLQDTPNDDDEEL